MSPFVAWWGEDQRRWATQGKTNLILDNLIAEGKAKPMLIVILDGNSGIPLGPGNLGTTGDSFLKVFENELKSGAIPFVESIYRVEANAADRALVGLLMGGIQTLYAGIKNRDMFSSLGVFSSGWFGNNNALSGSH